MTTSDPRTDPNASAGAKQAHTGRRVPSWILPAVLVSLGPILLFGPMVARGQVLYWGTPLLQFTPWREFAFDLIARGVSPLWSPLLGMGAPLLANHQSALLYPPNWILPLIGIAWGQGVLVLLHLALSGIGMTLLLRRMGLSVLAQVVGGIALASGSYLVARAGFLSMNAAAAWLPWLVLCADHLATAAAQRAWRASLGPALAVSAIITAVALAGHAQTLVYSLVLAIAWSVWRSIDLGGLRTLGRSAPLWLGSGVLAVSVAGAQVVPTIEYLLESSRAVGLDEASALTYSFWPWRGLGLLLPGLFGNPAFGDYWGYANYWEDALYVGVLPLLMAAAAAGWAGRLGRGPSRLRFFLLGAAAIALLLALGQNTPVFGFLFRSSPIFGWFNAPTRWNLVTTFALAGLAAIGADLWRRPTGRGLYWTRLGTAGAIAMMGVGLAVLLLPSGLRQSYGRAFVTTSLWLVSAGVLTLAWPRLATGRWIALVAAVVTLDLAVANFGLNPAAEAGLYAGQTRLAETLGREHRVFLFPEAEEVLKFDRTHRFDSFQADEDPWRIRESGLPNTPLLDRLPSVNNFDPLVPERFASWIGGLEARGAARSQALLASMDVAWYAEDVGEDPPWVEYLPVERPRRAWLVPTAIAVEDADDALRIVMEDGFDPARSVVLEGEPDVDRSGGSGVVMLHEAIPSPDVRLEVEAPSGGWLVLADTWYPGWQVTIDGEATTGYPANAAFRAVWVPAGEHVVEWAYRPFAWRVGVGLSGVGLVVMGGLAALWLVRRRSG